MLQPLQPLQLEDTHTIVMAETRERSRMQLRAQRQRQKQQLVKARKLWEVARLSPVLVTVPNEMSILLKAS